MRGDCRAAARTAITDGVESAQHGIFEESMVHVPPLILFIQDSQRLSLADAPPALGMLVDHHPHERLPDDDANVHRLAGVFFGRPAGSFDHSDVGRFKQNQIAGFLVGDDVFEVLEMNILLYLHQLAG